MYKQSEEFNTAILGDNRVFSARIVFENDETIEDVGNINKHSQIVSGNVFSIGGAISSYVTLDLWQHEFQINGKEFDLEIGIDTDSGIEWCSVGKYTADKPKASMDGMVAVTAYDRMQSKMSGTYFSNLTYPTDAINILNEISAMTGVPIVTDNLSLGVIVDKIPSSVESNVDVNGEPITITNYKNPFDGYMFRDVIGYIAMLYCKYAVVDRTGSVRFIWYTDNNYNLTDNRYYDDFKIGESVFTVGTIACNTSSGEILSGTGVTNVQLENPVMTQERLDYIYNQIKDFQFIPVSLSFIGDIRIEPGDIVSMEKTNGISYRIPVMNVVQEFDGGLKTSIDSFGEPEQENTVKGPIAAQLDRYNVEMLLVKELIGTKARFDYVHALYGEFETLKTNNIIGENGWINLAKGTFNYGDQLVWDGSKLSISAEAIQLSVGDVFALKKEASDASKTATNYLNFSSNGLVIGNHTVSTLGRNVLIASDRVDIRNGSTVLASYRDKEIHLGMNAQDSNIYLCKNAGHIYVRDGDLVLTAVNGHMTIYGNTSVNISSQGSNSSGATHTAEFVSYSASAAGTYTIMHARKDQDNAYIEDAYVRVDSHLITLESSVGSNAASIIMSGEYKTIAMDAGTIEMNASVITASCNIRLDNNRAIHAKGTDGSSMSIVGFSAENNTSLGYGAYYSGIGATNIYGNVIRFYTKSPNVNWKPYFSPGDSITVRWRGAGTVTGDGKSLVYSIPLAKPAVGCSGVTVTTDGGFVCRQNNKYCYGSSSDTPSKSVSSHSAGLNGDSHVRINTTMSNNTNVTNNDSIAIDASVKITFT